MEKHQDELQQGKVLEMQSKLVSTMGKGVAFDPTTPQDGYVYNIMHYPLREPVYVTFAQDNTGSGISSGGNLTGKPLIASNSPLQQWLWKKCPKTVDEFGDYLISANTPYNYYMHRDTNHIKATSNDNDGLSEETWSITEPDLNSRIKVGPMTTYYIWKRGHNLNFDYTNQNGLILHRNETGINTPNQLWAFVPCYRLQVDINSITINPQSMTNTDPVSVNVGISNMENKTGVAVTEKFTYGYKETRLATLTTSEEIQVGSSVSITQEFTVSLPLDLGGSKTTVNASFNFSYKNGVTHTNTTTNERDFTAEIDVTIPPNTVTNVQWTVSKVINKQVDTKLTGSITGYVKKTL